MWHYDINIIRVNTENRTQIRRATSIFSTFEIYSPFKYNLLLYIINIYIYYIYGKYESRTHKNIVQLCSK